MEQFPEEVKQFILGHINSVEQLEVLLLVRSQPNQEWDALTVSRLLYTDPAAAAMRLHDLQQAGLLTERGDLARHLYRYCPKKQNQHYVLNLLANLYKERRAAVINLIYSQPIARVQTYSNVPQPKPDRENS